MDDLVRNLLLDFSFEYLRISQTKSLFQYSWLPHQEFVSIRFQKKSKITNTE